MMNTDPIDNLAQSFLIGLVLCSALSDGYLLFQNYIQDKNFQKNTEYYSDVYKAVTSYSFNKYTESDDGSVIISDPIEINPLKEVVKEVVKEEVQEEVQKQEIEKIIPKEVEMEIEAEMEEIQEIHKMKEIKEDTLEEPPKKERIRMEIQAKYHESDYDIERKKEKKKHKENKEWREKEKEKEKHREKDHSSHELFRERKKK